MTLLNKIYLISLKDCSFIGRYYKKTVIFFRKHIATLWFSQKKSPSYKSDNHNQHTSKKNIKTIKNKSRQIFMRIWTVTLFLFFIFPIYCIENPLKVLHLSFHSAQIKEIEFLSKKFEFDLITWNPLDNAPYEDGNIFFCPFDGYSRGNRLYNIGHCRAQLIWELHKNFFKQFDLIITSDTAPLSRIFLQNNCTIPLMIWICNRLDYTNTASLDCEFPDAELYALFRKACRKKHTQIFSCTPFEIAYAHKKNIKLKKFIIKPLGIPDEGLPKKPLTLNKINREVSFFVLPYHNDKTLPKILDALEISYYQGQYADLNDQKNFKGTIHIPHAWSSFTLFKNWSNEMIYFIPSKDFLKELSEQIEFFWSPPLDWKELDYSEWYLPQHQNLFVYFDSWEDLKRKIIDTDYKNMKEKIKNFMHAHTEENLEKWENVLKKAKEYKLTKQL